MRIALVTLRFAAPGGVETTVAALARGFRQAGEEVTVYASDLYDEGRWERRTEFPPEVEGVPVRWFPVHRKLVPGVTMPLFVGLIDALGKDRPDLIHAHSHRYGHVLESAIAAHGRRIPFVVSPHYHPADRGEPAHKRLLLRGQDFLFGSTVYREARALIVETALESRALQEFAPARKLHVVPPGIDLPGWSDPALDAGVPSPASLPDRYFLFAGRIAPNKGLEHLFAAAAQLPADARLPIVLMGKDWGERPRLEELARKLGIESRLIWLGHVSEPGIYRRVFRRAVGLVLPSEYEAFGLVLLEAMAAGIPIVATAVGGVPEVLEGGRSGELVPYGDAAALALAMASMATGREGVRSTTARATERVQEFGLDRMIDRHLVIYRAAAGA